MRPPIQRIAQDLTNALNNISRLADNRTREAKVDMSETIAESVREVLPKADVIISQNSQNHFIDVTDDNLQAREFGSFSQEADRPIARALENVTLR